MITIYRLTNLSDNIGNVSDKIVFNTSKNSKVSNGMIPHYEIGGQSGVGDNQSAAQDTSNLQPLGKVEDLYVFKGYISKRDDLSGFNALVVIMQGWDVDPKVNGNWPNGRFGVKIDDFRPYDIVPANSQQSSQIGLLWQYLKWTNDFERSPLQANFELAFKVSRSDGT